MECAIILHNADVLQLVIFQGLTAASMKMTAFLDIAECSLVVYRRFRGEYCLHNQGDKNHNSLPWWWRQYALLKRRSNTTRLHGAISQQALIFCSLFLLRLRIISSFIIQYAYCWRCLLSATVHSLRLGFREKIKILLYDTVLYVLYSL
jgi:hypothetical protein